MSPRTSRLDPRIVRQVLNYAETHTTLATAALFKIHHSTVYRWKGYRAEKGPDWPTDQDIADWNAKAPERARNAVRKRRYNHRRHFAAGPVLVDATGTIRRLQALAVLGHSQRDIGQALGLSNERISQIARGRHRKVRPETARAVAKLYRRWCAIPSTNPGANMVRQYAARRSWVSGILWANIDDPKARPDHQRTARGVAA